MKKTNLLVALSIGILASSSGMIQVGAATYNYFVDFSTKEVANFTPYKQTFTTNTFNLDSHINFYFLGSYRFDSCPTPFVINNFYEISYSLNGTAPLYFIGGELPDFTCTTTPTTYLATVSIPNPINLLQGVVNDDANFMAFAAYIGFRVNPAATGRTLTLSGYRSYFDITYDFNTTYLFNYFLSDQQFISRTSSGSWTFTASRKVSLLYVYTTAGDDEYYIYNSPASDIGITRKKYAINYNDVFFRGESVGAAFNVEYTGSDTLVLGNSLSLIQWNYRYYYLNTSNLAQAIVDAPVFNFDYDDCGSFLALNVGCFINNGLAYITNDAPIISDAITLLNAGIEFAAQTFGIIGNFADDNIFGFLILVGFGFIAIKWLIKND